ncbi:MAG TPA: DUF72 domain-containing protein [Nitrososphaeraceae archaeon]|nr:DUF72 domain-containing protein [Nitrososphaeraceae archaeon]
MQYHIGCSGWSYTAWLGPFYPSKLENTDWLRYYSQIFDYVEIDSSFYRMPNKFMVKNWVKKTPDNFRFTAKFPKIITHDKHLVDVNEEVCTFLNNMEPLQEKTLALLIQLPPSMEIMPGLEGLKELLPYLDGRFRYAVEVRHSSWFQDLAYNFFTDNNICMAWSQLAHLRTPPIVTTDFLYVRFIGDRSIDEKDFGKIQKDRILEMKRWANEVKKAETGKIRGRRNEVNLAMIAANNHYAGFGPGTASLFRKMVGLSELSWENRNQLQERLELRKRQLQQLEQDQQVRNSSKASPKNTRKRQSSLVEFMG